jgi:hypothetical protein
MTRAVTNRQSMAIVIATRIQDGFSSNRPHLLCVNGPQVVATACGPTAHLPGRSLRYRIHTRKVDANILGFPVSSQW